MSTFQTVVNAFRPTGIEPFDSNIFRDEDFQSSNTTDIPSAEGSNHLIDPAGQLGPIELQSASVSSADQPF